jgi:hypothetical protein
MVAACLIIAIMVAFELVSGINRKEMISQTLP